MVCSMDCKIEITHHFGVLSQKPLVSVFVPLRSFSTQISQKFNVPNFCTSKFLVMTVQFFCTSKFLVMKSGFSALQSFCSKVHTTPYRWSSPYDAPMTVYDFCTTLVHCPERVTHRKSPLWLPILVMAPNFV